MSSIREIQSALDLLVRRRGRVQQNKMILEEAIKELALLRDSTGGVCPDCGSVGPTPICGGCGGNRVSRAVIALRDRDATIARQSAVIREFTGVSEDFLE